MVASSEGETQRLSVEHGIGYDCHVGDGLQLQQRVRGAVVRVVRKVRRWRERITFTVYAGSTGLGAAPRLRTEEPLVRGVRRFRRRHVRFLAAEPPRSPSKRAVVPLTDTLALEVAIEPRSFLEGLVISVTRTSVTETYGWNFLPRAVFPGFEGRAGRVWVETDEETAELTAIHCVTDVVLGATSVVPLESNEAHDIEVVLAAGSVVRLR